MRSSAASSSPCGGCAWGRTPQAWRRDGRIRERHRPSARVRPRPARAHPGTLANRLRLARIHASGVAWGGIAVMAAELALGARSARALGASYTRTPRTSAGHALVEEGPYR